MFFRILGIFINIRLVRQPGWLSHKSGIFSGKNPAKMQFFKEVVQKLKFLNNSIIAHSRGGLEARYLISTMNIDYAVASLTTISTPHYGVGAMNIIVELPIGFYKFVSFFVNIWFRILGDKNPDFFTSSRQLSQKYSIQFNERNHDRMGIYYQSYASMLKYFFSDLIFIILHPLITFADGDNDGLCPVESAKWGDFKGVITTQGIFGISHCGIIDLYRINYKGVNILDIYLNMAKELFKRGYKNSPYFA